MINPNNRLIILIVFHESVFVLHGPDVTTKSHNQFETLVLQERRSGMDGRKECGVIVSLFYI